MLINGGGRWQRPPQEQQGEDIGAKHRQPGAECAAQGSAEPG